jgi:hypothetical protein
MLPRQVGPILAEDCQVSVTDEQVTCTYSRKALPTGDAPAASRLLMQALRGQSS